MTVINRSATVQYSPAQMFALVNDIEAYPEFMPWCRNSEIISSSDDEIKASLVLAGAGIQKTFTTLNRLQQDKMIEIRLLDGPFKHLEGFWRFDQTEQGGCHVMLDLEFEFAGWLVDLAFGPVFHQIANSLVDSFQKRAEQVYA